MDRSITHSTFVIQREFTASPERLFSAFANAATKARWFGAGAVEFEMDFRPGGRERTRSVMGPNTPFPGTSLINETVYLEIAPNQRLVQAYTMSVGDRRISASLATFEFLTTENGSKLIFTEQGAYFAGSDGAQIREIGWQHILDRLADANTDA